MKPAKKTKAKLASKKSANKSKPDTTTSIDGLHRLTGFDRRTISERLRVAQLQPNAKGEYNVRRAMAALLADHTGIIEARRRQLTAKAGIAELELAEKQVERLDANEVRDTLQSIFTRLFQQLVVQYPRDNKARLHRLKTAEQLGSALKHDIAQVFNDLRADFKRFL